MRPIKVAVGIALAGVATAAVGTPLDRFEQQQQHILEVSRKVDMLVEELQQLRAKVEEQEHRLKKGMTIKVAGNEEALIPVSEPLTAAQPALPMAEEQSVLAAEKDTYDAAYALLQAKEYGAAAKSFVALMQEYPEGQLVPNASYWLGELYFLDRHYGAARQAFKKVIDKYPEHAKASDSLLKLGYLEYEEGHFADAFKVLTALQERFPDAPAARLATARIERMRQEGQIKRP